MGDGIAAAKIEKHNARAINAAGVMKRSIRLVSLLVFSCCSVLTISADVNVTENTTILREMVFTLIAALHLLMLLV